MSTATGFHRPRVRAILGAGALLTSICASAQLCAATGIYRCETADGAVLYSQFDCPETHLQAGVAPERHSFVEMPPLSGPERAALKALERSLERNRAARAKARHTARQHRRRELQSRTRACRAARAELTRLRERKRRGYSAAEARSLHQRQRELSEQKKENC